MRILVTGASGSGTTTLGQALAGELDCAHLDSDDYFWLPTQSGRRQVRDPAQRLSLLAADLDQLRKVVLSGSIVDWGNAIEDAFDFIVFLYLPREIRLQRLVKRASDNARVLHPEFLRWAAQYDEGIELGRSLAQHKAWLARRTCPILRLETELSVAESLSRVLRALPDPAP